MDHFDFLGVLDPKDVRAALVEHEAHFQAHTWRQATEGSPHSDTETIYLRMPSVITRDTIFEGLEVVDYPAMEIPAFAKAIQDLGRMVYGGIARAMIVRLRPWGFISPHVDEGGYSLATGRCHWVIETNPDCSCRIENELVHMEDSEVWWFDKHARHCCGNEGETPRVHLIFDVWSRP
jgi:hypothetical protein